MYKHAYFSKMATRSIKKTKKPSSYSYNDNELKRYQDWQTRCKEVGTLADPNKKNQKLFYYYNQGNTARRVGLLAGTILAKRERSQAIAASLWILEFFFSVNK